MQYTLDWMSMAEITVTNNEEYARLHKYSFIPEIFESNYSGYSKFETIQKLFLYTETDVVFSLDCDALITNHAITVEKFLDKEHDFYICKDYNGLNAGSFIIKKSQWSYQFINYVLDQKGKDGMYCEQNGIEAYMREYPNSEKTKILPHPSINSYLYENYPEIPLQTHQQGQWEASDMILHLPGIGYDKRLGILKNIKVIR